MTYHPSLVVTQPLGVSPKLKSHLHGFDVANARDLLCVQAKGTSFCRGGGEVHGESRNCTVGMMYACHWMYNMHGLYRCVKSWGRVGTLKLKNKHHIIILKPWCRPICVWVHLDLRLPYCTQRIHWTQNMERFRLPMKTGCINESLTRPHFKLGGQCWLSKISTCDWSAFFDNYLVNLSGPGCKKSNLWRGRTKTHETQRRSGSFWDSLRFAKTISILGCGDQNLVVAPHSSPFKWRIRCPNRSCPSSLPTT